MVFNITATSVSAALLSSKAAGAWVTTAMDSCGGKGSEFSGCPRPSDPAEMQQVGID